MATLHACERAACFFRALCCRSSRGPLLAITRGAPPQADCRSRWHGCFVPGGCGREGVVMEHLWTASKGWCSLARISCLAVQAADPVVTEEEDFTSRKDLRNIAIIAHVDHGKTTLVDAMLKQSHVFRDNQSVKERVMDSNDLERERGITILSKNTAVRYEDIKINIIDTPGHADFGGEVERILNLCDGVLLLVDAVEGPMPQTRFVLRKALELDKKVIVVVNKIDRPTARADFVVDATFELFLELGASDEQCNFPVVYASGMKGIAGMKVDDMGDSLKPLFETIIKEISPPTVKRQSPLQMLVTTIDYDEHKGRIAIGRAASGVLRQGAQVTVCREGVDGIRPGKVSELFVYDNFKQVPVSEVLAGDICAIAGLPAVQIGETITCPDNPVALPTIKIEEPTVTMTFLVNTSPFAGKEGKLVTSRNIKERLERELEKNLALRVSRGETTDAFVVSGRGALHLGILIETMRREGYEFAVGPMKVITKRIDGEACEPFEETIVEVPEEHMGPVVELFGQRKAQMLSMSAGLGSSQLIKYVLPTRGLVGLRSQLLTATKGTAVLNTVFAGYKPFCGDLAMRANGSLVAHETGTATAYALESCQERGTMFIKPGEEVYEGQVVGINSRPQDLRVNVCKKKHVSNVRSATKDQTVVLDQAKIMSLEDALEYINNEELVEVTPKAIRVRKSPKMVKKSR